MTMARLIDADALMETWNLGNAKKYGNITEEDQAFSYDTMFMYEIADMIEDAPTIEAEPVKHGKWLLKAYKEPSNYRWNVKAECSECCDEEKEIWAGFFPNVPDWLARDVAIQYAEEVKMSNYCPNCGARMDGE